MSGIAAAQLKWVDASERTQRRTAEALKAI
jgi:hypothetical protein